MKYSIAFDNNMTVSFETKEDIQFDQLDQERPLTFDNIYVNLSHVVFIQKEGDEK
ncbi:MAG: hypothetical protein IKY16_02595 [Bacteroidales bacterium]|nr:hypothetical protein [Bacteroidales bacterium]